MKEFQSLLKGIKNKSFLPIYFFQGEESFYIDKLLDALDQNVLTEDEKAFNQHTIYGKETDIEQITSIAKQFPMGAEKQLILVKEAQHLSFKKDIEKEVFEEYILNPQPTTILAFGFKKKLDGRSSIASKLKKIKALYASEKIRDYQIQNWILTHTRDLGMTIDDKSAFLLAEYLGENLSKIDNELNKLKSILENKTKITPELIEKHIGISKEYNNFELTKAIGSKNAKKAFQIADYFIKNSRANPLVVTVSLLFNYFLKILTVHITKDKSTLDKELGVPKFILQEYLIAAKHYPLKKVTKTLEHLQELDLKSKGVGFTNSVSEGELLKEFLYKTIYL